jgi:hypothetical protein
MLDYKTENNGQRAIKVLTEFEAFGRLQDLLNYIDALEKERDEYKQEADDLQSEVNDLAQQLEAATEESK